MLSWRNGRATRLGANQNNHASSAEPTFGSLGPSGIIAGTMIATEAGWQRVETLNAGDMVMTFDHGPQRLRSISRRLCPGPSDGDIVAQPLLSLSPGTAGNTGALLLLPGQGVVLESDAAEALYGDPFALLPAQSLTCLSSVSLMLSETPVIAVSLSFEGDELVYADGQALLYCEASGMAAPATLDDAIFGASQRYTMLHMRAAMELTTSAEK